MFYVAPTDYATVLDGESKLSERHFPDGRVLQNLRLEALRGLSTDRRTVTVNSNSARGIPE